MKRPSDYGEPRAPVDYRIACSAEKDPYRGIDPERVELFLGKLDRARIEALNLTSRAIPIRGSCRKILDDIMNAMSFYIEEFKGDIDKAI